MEADQLSNAEEGSIDQIIYAWNYLSWGGAQIYFLGLIKEAQKHFSIKVLMPTGSDEQLVSFFREQGVECEFFSPSFDRPSGRGLGSRIRMHLGKIASERAMVRSLNENFDLTRSIVHTELAPWQSLISLVRLLKRAPVFVTMHNSLTKVNVFRRMIWKLKLQAISRFDRFTAFASNRDAREFFKSLFSTGFHERILITYTNINPAEIDIAYEADIDSPMLKRRHGLPEDHFLVFCVGQFIDRKGRWVFLDAARILSDQHSNVHFVWISNSGLSAEDAERVKSFGLEGRFSLIESDRVGPEHTDLFKLIRVADAFALPSLQEGLPISLLEAMALGVPSVSTRVNAIPEAIEERRTGLLVEPGDAEGLAHALGELIEDRELREQLGRRGREKVLKDFNERTVAKIALGAYLKAAGKSKI